MNRAWVEPERNSQGGLSQVATLLVPGPRCAFPCRHCDLWHDALPSANPPGFVVGWVRQALHTLPHADWIKLYNAGNFTDPRSIPREDYDPLAQLIRPFQRVIIENHPRLPLAPLRQWSQCFPGQLEVAIGLETANATILKSLNKRMSVDDYRRAADQLGSWSINLRTFVVFGLPGIPAAEHVQDVLNSVTLALEVRSRHVSIIAYRSTNDSASPSLPAPRPWRVLLEGVQERLAPYRSDDDSPVVTIDLWGLTNADDLETLQAWNFRQQMAVPRDAYTAG